MKVLDVFPLSENFAFWYPSLSEAFFLRKKILIYKIVLI